MVRATLSGRWMLAVALLVLAAAAAVLWHPAAPRTEGAALPDLSLEGYVPVEINLTQTTVILTANCRRIEAETTEAQTFSIAKGLEGSLDFRPTTHDLIQDVFEHFDIVPVLARIDRYEDGTYYATLAVERGDELLVLDVRPTDAMGVAVRYELPVHIHEAVLAERGERVC